MSLPVKMGFTSCLFLYKEVIWWLWRGKAFPLCTLTASVAAFSPRLADRVSLQKQCIEMVTDFLAYLPYRY
jgi:hypothetical protein